MASFWLWLLGPETKLTNDRGALMAQYRKKPVAPYQEPVTRWPAAPGPYISPSTGPSAVWLVMSIYTIESSTATATGTTATGIVYDMIEVR
jgi:hypothetical protein